MSELTVRDMGTLFDGPHATPTRIESGPYFLNIASLSGGRLELDQSDHVSEADFEKWTKRVEPTEGDLLFSYETRLGEAALMPAGVRACLGRRMALIRPNRAVVNPKFLLYYYLSPGFQRTIEQHTIHGATVNRISLSTMGAWPVAVPSLGEQQAIAEVLGALDAKITANTKLAKTSAILAQTLFARSLRDADHEVALSEITELLSRGVAPKYSEAEDTVVVLNQKCIRDQRVNLDPARRTLVSKVRKDKMLRMDDVLVNSTGQGTLGRVARWTQSGGVTVDSHITIVRFDQAKVDPVCAGMALLASQQTIEEMGEGSTGQTELSRTELGKLRLRLPERSQQAEVGHRIKSMSEMESARLRENQTLAATRDTLLPQLMSGKLRIKDAEKVLENAGV